MNLELYINHKFALRKQDLKPLHQCIKIHLKIPRAFYIFITNSYLEAWDRLLHDVTSLPV